MKNLATLGILILISTACQKDDYYASKIQSKSSGLEDPAAVDHGTQEAPKDAQNESSNDTPLVDPVVPVVPEVVENEPEGSMVCDPLNGEGSDSSIKLGYGLTGVLYDGNGGAVSRFEDLLQKGVVLDKSVYLSQLFIPTRKFDEGFQSTDGALLMNSQNEALIENFGLDLSSELALSASDGPGYYEIALIADDGVGMDADQQNIIQADILTPSKMSCAKMLVRMEAGKNLPISVRYFQGPRYHIALVMLWRKVKELSDGKDNLIPSDGPKEANCGASGNYFFFNPDANSKPSQAYLDLLNPAKRSIPWNVVKLENFKLPQGSSNQECLK